MITTIMDLKFYQTLSFMFLQFIWICGEYQRISIEEFIKIENFIALFSKNDMKSFNQLILPILKKTCGIVLKHRGDLDVKFRMCLKENHEAPMAIQNVQLIFPDCNLIKILLVLEL